jgi:hypothetical protein
MHESGADLDNTLRTITRRLSQDPLRLTGQFLGFGYLYQYSLLAHTMENSWGVRKQGKP